MIKQEAVKRLAFLRALFNFALQEKPRDLAIKSVVEALDIAIEAIKKEAADNGSKNTI